VNLSQPEAECAVFPRNRGLQQVVTRRDNGGMKSTRRDFKDTQLFGWDSEPSEQRASEFAQSTGYSALSGYHAVAEPRRKPKATGTGFLFVMSALIVGLGAVGLYWLAQVLRG
jgi:hypothetical protein